MSMSSFVCVCGDTLNSCRCGNFTPLDAPVEQKRAHRQVTVDREANAKAEAARQKRDDDRYGTWWK